MEALLAWGIDFIVWIQAFSSPFLDGVFKAITFLGDEKFYLILLPLIFWCLNKGLGAKLVFLFLFSAYANNSLKDIFRAPRPCQFAPDKGKSHRRVRGIWLPKRPRSRDGRRLGVPLLASAQGMAMGLRNRHPPTRRPLEGIFGRALPTRCHRRPHNSRAFRPPLHLAPAICYDKDRRAIPYFEAGTGCSRPSCFSLHPSDQGYIRLHGHTSRDGGRSHTRGGIR